MIGYPDTRLEFEGMHRKNLFTSFLLVTLCLASSVLSRVGFAQLIEAKGQTMGTIEYKVRLDSLPEELDPQEVGESIQSELDDVNDLMSTYIPDSDVSRFNDYQDIDWFAVSADTAKVIERALEISEQTNGAFDITVGPLVELWHFGPDKGSTEIPKPQAILDTQGWVGYQKLEVRLDPPALKKSLAEVRIDLSAIAKGYAVDRVAVKLDSLGVENYMVLVGGDGRTKGTKSDGSSWQIGIEKPDPKQFGTFQKIAPLETSSMATSGDYRNFFIVDGVWYSHTINPKTGKPVTHNLASASVIADDCMTADAFATAALVLGKDKAVTLLDDLGMDYHLITREKSKLSETTSSGLSLLDPGKKRNGTQGRSLLPMFIGTAVIFGLAILGMAVGAIVNNKPITGSCGGLSASTNIDGDTTNCSLCHKPTMECPDLDTKEA